MAHPKTLDSGLFRGDALITMRGKSDIRLRAVFTINGADADRLVSRAVEVEVWLDGSARRMPQLRSG